MKTRFRCHLWTKGCGGTALIIDDTVTIMKKIAHDPEVSGVQEELILCPRAFNNRQTTVESG